VDKEFEQGLENTEDEGEFEKSREAYYQSMAARARGDEDASEEASRHWMSFSAKSGMSNRSRRRFRMWKKRRFRRRNNRSLLRRPPWRRSRR